MAKSTFEKNGGYFIDGVAYMDCKSQVNLYLMLVQIRYL